MSYPYSLKPGQVTLTPKVDVSAGRTLTEQRVAGALRQKELLNNQKDYSLKLDRNRLAGYDRLLFGPNALSSLYPHSSKQKYASTSEERDIALAPYSTGDK